MTSQLQKNFIFEQNGVTRQLRHELPLHVGERGPGPVAARLQRYRRVELLAGNGHVDEGGGREAYPADGRVVLGRHVGAVVAGEAVGRRRVGRRVAARVALARPLQAGAEPRVTCNRDELAAGRFDQSCSRLLEGIAHTPPGSSFW